MFCWSCIYLPFCDSHRADIFSGYPNFRSKYSHLITLSNVRKGRTCILKTAYLLKTNKQTNTNAYLLWIKIIFPRDLPFQHS